MENRKSENRPAQRDSIMYNFGVCCSPLLSRTVDFGTCPRRAKATTPKAIFENGRLSGLFCRWQCAQRHSKNSNGRLSGLFCWPQGQDIENSSAHRDSKMTKSEMGVLGRLRCMGKRHKIENSSAQPHSKFSNLVLPLCLCASVVNRLSAQRDSIMYKSEKTKVKR